MSSDSGDDCRRQRALPGATIVAKDTQSGFLSCRNDASLARRADAARAGLVLSLRQPLHGRPRVAKRVVLDRHGAPARRRAHRQAVLCERPGCGSTRRRRLPAGGFPVDAGRASHDTLARVEAGIRIPAGTVGSLLRADDSLCPRDRISHARDPARILARVVASDHEVPAVHVRRLVGSPLRASVLACLGGFPRSPRETVRARLVRELGHGHPRSQGVLSQLVIRVPRLCRWHLGHHRLGQQEGLCGLGWTTTPPGHPVRSCLRRRPAL